MFYWQMHFSLNLFVAIFCCVANYWRDFGSVSTSGSMQFDIGSILSNRFTCFCLHRANLKQTHRLSSLSIQQSKHHLKQTAQFQGNVFHFHTNTVFICLLSFDIVFSTDNRLNGKYTPVRNLAAEKDVSIEFISVFVVVVVDGSIEMQ